LILDIRFNKTFSSLIKIVSLKSTHTSSLF
jgi:hypothetical protein